MERKLPDWMSGAVELKENWYLLRNDDGTICIVFMVADDWVYTCYLPKEKWEAAFKALEQA